MSPVRHYQHDRRQYVYHVWLPGSQPCHRNGLPSGTHNIGLGARLIERGDRCDAGGRRGDGNHSGRAGWFRRPPGLSPRATMIRCLLHDPGILTGMVSCWVMVRCVAARRILDSAKARGAHIYAELSGFGMSGDAYHMTSPPEDGRGAAQSMEQAVQGCRYRMSLISATSMPMEHRP